MLKRGNITLKNSREGCIIVLQARKSLKREMVTTTGLTVPT